MRVTKDVWVHFKSLGDWTSTLARISKASLDDQVKELIAVFHGIHNPLLSHSREDPVTKISSKGSSVQWQSVRLSRSRLRQTQTHGIQLDELQRPGVTYKFGRFSQSNYVESTNSVYPVHSFLFSFLFVHFYIPSFLALYVSYPAIHFPAPYCPNLLSNLYTQYTALKVSNLRRFLSSIIFIKYSESILFDFCGPYFTSGFKYQNGSF